MVSNVIIHQYNKCLGSMGSVIMHSVPGEWDGPVMCLNPLSINEEMGDVSCVTGLLKHILTTLRLFKCSHL